MTDIRDVEIVHCSPPVGLRFVLLASAAALLSLSPHPAIAQSAPPPAAGEPGGDIIVTASRREEGLSKVPISVAAYTQEALDLRSVRTVDDLARLTTGVNLVQNSPVRGFAISIRGIDSRVGANTVGIYIDDTPIQVRKLGQFATNIYPQLFDLERVEVLRGPQGTLFGAGSEGGTVRFITPEPNFDRLSVYSRAEVATTEHGDESYEGGMALGLPLVTDKLGLRASAFYRRDGGWIDRVNPDTNELREKDTNRMSTLALRASLGWRASDGVTITPSLFYQRRKINNSNQFWNLRSSVPGTPGVPEASVLYTVPFSRPGKGKFLSGDDMAQPGVEKFLLASLKAEAELGSVTAIANVAYFKSDSDFTFDFGLPDAAVFSQGAFTRIPGYINHNDQLDRQKNYTAEVRLQPTTPNERFNWVIGGFYSHQRQTAFGGIGGASLDALVTAFQPIFGFPPGTTAAQLFGQPAYQPGNYALVFDNRSTDEQVAGFADVSYAITPKLKATAGVRVARLDVDFFAFTAGPFAGPPQSSSSKSRATPITPKFNLSYQADDRNLFYATAAKGFRAGGGNTQVPALLCGAALAAVGLTDVPRSYRPDSLWSYELGSKNKLLDNRLQIDANVFQINWNALQQQVFLPCQFSYVANAGSARSRGFDLQLTMRPIDALTVTAAVGRVDAKYTKTVYPGPVPGTGPNSVIVRKGDVIDTPPWTVSLNARVDLPLGGVDGYLIGDYIYRSRNKRQSPVQDPLSVAFEGYPTLDATSQINLRAGIRLGKVDASLFVNNLTNDFPILYYRQDYRGTLLLKNGSLRPRTVGLTVSHRM